MHQLQQHDQGDVQASGKKVNCPKCGHVLKIPLKSASVNPTGPQTKTPSSIAKTRQPSEEVVQESILLDEELPVGRSSTTAEDDYEDYNAPTRPRKSKRRSAVVDDYDEYPEYGPDNDQYGDYDDDRDYNPAPSRRRPKKKKKKKRKNTESGTNWIQVAAGIFAILGSLLWIVVAFTVSGNILVRPLTFFVIGIIVVCTSSRNS